MEKERKAEKSKQAVVSEEKGAHAVPKGANLRVQVATGRGAERN